MELPKIGDKIYVPSACYISRGSDDIQGGIATISSVDISKTLPIDNYNSVMVGVKEIPNKGYNYRYLLEKQEELKK